MEPALDGTHTLDDVYDEVAAGRAQFWPFANSAVVTVVNVSPRARTLRIWLAGGELGELLAALARADEYARYRLCDRIEIDGRKGWARVMEGYQESRVVLTKEVT